jgi:hypothetical protein
VSVLREIFDLILPHEQRRGRWYYTGGYGRLLFLAVVVGFYVYAIADILR